MSLDNENETEGDQVSYSDRDLRFAKAAMGVAKDTDIALTKAENFAKIYTMLKELELNKEEVLGLARQFAEAGENGHNKNIDNCCSSCYFVGGPCQCC